MRWWWEPCSQWACVSIMQTLLQFAWYFCWQLEHLLTQTCLLTPNGSCRSSHLKERGGSLTSVSLQCYCWWWITEEHVPLVLMLQNITSDLQAPEMSPGHTLGTLTPERKINSIVSTLTGNGQLLVTDPLWTCSRSPGHLCSTSAHLACCEPISAWSGTRLSSTGRQWSCASALLHSTPKKRHHCPAMD